MAKECRRKAVPNPAWVLLYRLGLSRKRIADLAVASPSTVGYHLSVAKAKYPELKAEHDSASGKTVTPPVRPGLWRMYEAIAFVEETGRYPSPAADDPAERQLAAWVRRRRRDARAGTLDPELRDGLAVLPHWQRKPREAKSEMAWRQQLDNLVAYRLAGNDWPRHKAASTDKEYGLGSWLHTQRFKLRRGELSPRKLEALDAALPGWLAGRKRGKKAGVPPEQAWSRPL